MRNIATKRTRYFGSEVLVSQTLHGNPPTQWYIAVVHLGNSSKPLNPRSVRPLGILPLLRLFVRPFEAATADTNASRSVAHRADRCTRALLRSCWDMVSIADQNLQRGRALFCVSALTVKCLVACCCCFSLAICG